MTICEVCEFSFGQHDGPTHALADAIAKLGALHGALSERMAKLEVGRAELHDRCDVLSDAIGSLEQDALRPTREEASGQPASAGAATVPTGWKLAPGWSFGAHCNYDWRCWRGLNDDGEEVGETCDARGPYLLSAGGVASKGACASHAVEMGALVRDEPPAEPFENIGGFGRVEQPSRQETPGGWATPCARKSCGHPESSHSVAGHAGCIRCPCLVFMEWYDDRAKAKAAEQAMATLAKERDAATLAMLREMPAEPSGNPGELAVEPSGAGQVPSAPAAGTLSERLREAGRRHAAGHRVSGWEWMAGQVAALEARLAQAELFLAVKDKVVAGFEERCKEADKKLAQAEQQSACAKPMAGGRVVCGINGALCNDCWRSQTPVIGVQEQVDAVSGPLEFWENEAKEWAAAHDEQVAKLAQAERERDAAAEEGRKRHLAAVLRAEEAERERDEFERLCDYWNEINLRNGELKAEAIDEATARERERCLDAVETYEPRRDVTSDWGYPGALAVVAERIRTAQCDPDPAREVAPDRTQQGGGR